MQLAGEDYDQVPIMHNEYVMLLVKSGVVGLVLYLVFLYGIGFKKVQELRDNSESYYCYQMLSALSVISLLNTYTGFGLIGLTGVTVPVIMGFFHGNIQRQKLAIETFQPQPVYA
jgi:O-antigen ligase